MPNHFFSGQSPHGIDSNLFIRHHITEETRPQRDTSIVCAATNPSSVSEISTGFHSNRVKLVTAWLILAAAMSAALLLMPDKVSADPSTKDPFAPLGLIDPESSGAYQQEALKLYNEIYKPISDIVQYAEKKNVRALKTQIRRIGPLYVKALQIQRLGDLLVAMHEPSGIDISARGEEMRSAIRSVALMMYKDPEYTIIIRRLTALITTRTKSHEQDVPKIEKIAATGQWLLVHKTIYNIIDDLHSLCVWLKSSTSRPHYLPFGKLLVEADTHLKEELTAKAIARLKERSAAQLPDYASSAETMDLATAEISAKGVTEIDGRTMTGPELLHWFVSSWLAMHNRSIRLQAIHQILGSEGDPTVEFELPKRINQFNDKAIDRIVSLIEADTASVPQAEVRTHYIHFLATLARLLPLLPEPGKKQVLFEESLRKLVEISPELVEEVDTYRAATEEILRWRLLLTEQQAEFHFNSIIDPSNRNRRTPIRRGTDLHEFHFGYRTLLKSAPTDIRKKGPDILMETVCTGPLRGLGKTNMAIGGYEKWTYALVPLPAAWKSETESLRRDLLCRSGSGGIPLTLAAARAIVSANEGHASLVGGKITEITIQSQMQFFITMPDIAGRLAPLGPNLVDKPNSQAINGAITRITIQPTWIAGPGFFIKLKPPAEGFPEIPAP